MKTGLLWLDDNPTRTLAEKVIRAAAQYRQKHGRVPNICYVHPTTLNGGPRQIGRLKIAPLSTVLPHHFWIGEEQREGLA